jgi:hypothetical protein
VKTEPEPMALELCRWLRWKSFTRDAEPGEFHLAFARNNVPYTCLRTCQPWGPDEDMAIPEGCNSARTCYEASPLAVVPPPPGPLRET